MIFALWFGCADPVEKGDEALARDDLLTAETQFRAALDADPEDPRALYGLGWTFHQAGEEAAARETFRQLARRHPDDPAGHRGLGSVLAAEGNPAGARVELEKALALAPDDVRAHQTLALLELSAGDAAAALVRVDGVIARGAEGSELHQARAAALVRLGRTDEAMAAASVALERADGARARAGARLAWVEAMLVHADDRVDDEACATTAPPVREWHDAADRVLDEVEAGGALSKAALDLRRQVRRRRAWVDDHCPGGG